MSANQEDMGTEEFLYCQTLEAFSRNHWYHYLPVEVLPSGYRLTTLHTLNCYAIKAYIKNSECEKKQYSHSNYSHL